MIRIIWIRSDENGLKKYYHALVLLSQTLVQFIDQFLLDQRRGGIQLQRDLKLSHCLSTLPQLLVYAAKLIMCLRVLRGQLHYGL